MKNGWPDPTNRNPSPAVDTDFLAIQALTFICGNPDHAARFMALSGIGPGDLRHAAADPGFLLGVMDYLVGDEPLLLLFADHARVSPQTIVMAHDRMTRR